MKLEIWFEFASTYSYLTVARAEPLLAEAGVDWAWRPFLLGPIFRDKGMETSPFLLDPIKGAYMWRDVERRATRLGLPFQKPPIFPMNGLLAARIATAAEGEVWRGAFARAVFAAAYARGEDISDPEVIKAALSAVGAAPEIWLAKAGAEETKAKLRQRTERAQALGVFGAPSITVGGELFWGDDRLEDAIAWAAMGGEDTTERDVR